MQTNGTMTQAPQDMLTAMALDALDALGTAETNYALAIDAATRANRTKRETEQAFKDAESELTWELMQSEAYAACKNAETRKAYLDAAMVKARKGERPEHYVYATAWGLYQNAINEDANAQMAQEQTRKAMHAAQYRVDLIASLARGH